MFSKEGVKILDLYLGLLCQLFAADNQNYTNVKISENISNICHR